MASSVDEVLEVDSSLSCHPCEEQDEQEEDAQDAQDADNRTGDDSRPSAAQSEEEESAGPKGPGTITDLCNSFTKLFGDSLYSEFDRHERDVRGALQRRRDRIAFKVNDTNELLEERDVNAAADADAGLGVWRHGDEFQGDVNLRTLKALLERIDQRGFERYALSTTRTHAHARHFPSPPPPRNTGRRTSSSFTRRSSMPVHA